MYRANNGMKSEDSYPVSGKVQVTPFWNYLEKQHKGNFHIPRKLIDYQFLFSRNRHTIFSICKPPNLGEDTQVG